jgi:hypothetical protein
MFLLRRATDRGLHRPTFCYWLKKTKKKPRFIPCDNFFLRRLGSRYLNLVNMPRLFQQMQDPTGDFNFYFNVENTCDALYVTGFDSAEVAGICRTSLPYLNIGSENGNCTIWEGIFSIN